MRAHRRIGIAASLGVVLSLPLIGGGATLAQDEEPGETARVIELEADAALLILDADGREMTDLAVVPGETILFRIDNTAGFDHNFYIGTEQELEEAWAETDAGIPTWSGGVREFAWTVPEDISGLEFGCTVPGHYFAFSGTISEATEPPEGPRVALIGPPPTPGIDGGVELQPAIDGYLPDGGRVEIPWVRVALVLPPGWSYSLGREPRSWTQDYPLFASYTTNEFSYGCSLMVDTRTPFTTGPGFAEVHGAEWEQVPVHLGGSAATRTDWVGWLGDTARYDVTSPDGWHYGLDCSVEDGEPPADRWMSIAETIEFLPAP